MASKKFKTHCRISDYIEAVDSELMQLLNGTCSSANLTTRGKPGLTFMRPKEAEYKKKIAELAYSDKVEDANKACDMLNACIIRNVFRTPDDWMSMKDDIPNSLFPNQHVEVDSVKGGEVIFKNGCKAKLDPDFKDSSQRRNLAVWIITSGEMPVTKDKDAKGKYKKVDVKAKMEGSAEEVMSTGRFKIITAIENMYILDRLNKTVGREYIEYSGSHDTTYPLFKMPFESRPRDIYLEYTMSLANYISNVDPGLFSDVVVPLISFQKIDLYNLIEPHKSTRQYLIPEDIINDWWMKGESFHMHDAMKKIVDALKSGGKCALYGNRAGIFHATDVLRRKVIGTLQSRFREAVDEIIAGYDKIDTDNSIGELKNIYPERLAKHYQDNPGLKMVQDELRYVTFVAFASMEQDPSFDRDRFETTIAYIADCLNASSLQGRRRVVRLLNQNTWRVQIQPTEKLGEIKTFVSSTHYMYIPLSPDEIASYPLKNTPSRPGPTHKIIWNIEKQEYIKNKSLFEFHDKGGSDTEDVTNIIARLSQMNIAKLPTDLRAAVARFA